jgi:hypothetical protein
MTLMFMQRDIMMAPHERRRRRRRRRRVSAGGYFDAAKGAIKLPPVFC